MSAPADPTSAPAPAAGPADDEAGLDPAALAALDRQLAQLGRDQQRRHHHQRTGRRNLWLAHRWPDDGPDGPVYDHRCLLVAGRPVCRRCAALYPLSLVVALASVAGHAPWPGRFDPWIVWLLSLPATVAYVGEAVGWFPYRPRWQVATTLVAALAFGRALGYELDHRWSGIFWGPIAVFGGIWFAATVVAQRRRQQNLGSGPEGVGQSAATASSSSSSVL